MKVSATQIPLVHRAWEYCAARLLATHSCDGNVQISSDLFHRYVYDRYSEPQRHYHNLTHLEEMLGYLAAYEQEHGWHGDYAPSLAPCTNAEAAASVTEAAADRVQHDWTGTALLLSILFHDVVYDPKRGDNEEVSADLAAAFLSEAQTHYTAASPLPSPASPSESTPLLWTNAAAAQFVRDTVRDYILQTKVHLSVQPDVALQLSAPPSNAAVAQSHDKPLHVFLDLDLSILGHPDPAVYRHRYAESIQREYSHYAPADFLKGRSAFLNGFLQHAQWYKTPFFFSRLEAQARHNTAAEVLELTAQLQALETTL